MSSRHPETNPHFLPPELRPREQNVANITGPVPQHQPRRQRTPPAPRFDPHYPLHVPEQGLHPQSEGLPREAFAPRGRARGPSESLEPHHPTHVPDQDRHSQPEGLPGQSFVPHGRARGPSRTSAVQPERPDTRQPQEVPDQDPHYQSGGLPRQGFVPHSRAHGPPGATVLPPQSPDYPDNYPLHPQGKGSRYQPLGKPEKQPPRKGKSRKSQVQWEQPPPQPGEEHAPPKGRHSSPVVIPGPDDSHRRRRRDHHPDLLVPPPRKTKVITWLIAVCCALFWIIIIVGGLIVLIVYLVFRPHIPRFDITSATLNAAYLDMDYLLNLDLTLLANFTNPNRKVHVDFSSIILDLYYSDLPIATQYIEPFSAMKNESRLVSVHMISSQVRFSTSISQLLQRKIQSNGPIVFEVKGLFRARSNLGSLLRYSYSLYSHCWISLSGPPSGILRASRCKTKR